NDEKAQAALVEAKAYLKDEQRKLKEFQRLVKRNAITQTEIDAQEASVEIAEARLDASKANFSDLNIRAPFAGTVGFIDFSRGKMVSAGSELLTLDDLSVMELDLQVPERYLSRLSVGMKVHASTSAWSDLDFIGKVTGIDTRIDTETLNLRIRIEFDNPENHLKPGMLMQAALVFPAIETPIIPVQALEYSGTKRFVYVIDENNKAKRQEVFLGARVGNEVVIESGVEVGNKIVVQGIVNMRDGVEVKEIIAPVKEKIADVRAEQGVKGAQDEATKEAN
ncbi:efflux RND transporter periplasmic adaptor subunit, partial [Vibrio sp. AND4]|uniref:efflux RND transporter periplasmic adaptor subunit n=1 Tax=Vibrio sp. AND4 TaxID=314289 RepID=UPI00015F2ECB